MPANVLLACSSEVLSPIVDTSRRVAPIGLFFLNGALLASGYQTRILHIEIDRLANEGYRAGVSNEVRRFNPQAIGFSFRNLFHWAGMPEDPTQLVNYTSMSREKAAIDFLRCLTDSPIVGGGPAFSLAPKLHMEYLGLDYGIRGEGEVSFPLLISRIQSHANPSDVPGLVYRTNETIVLNRVEIIADLAATPPMSTGDFPEYHSLYYEGAGYGSVQTKRGCAFNCLYCQYPFLEGKEYRQRPTETIMQEIDEIRTRHGVDHFFIVDSVFSTPVQRSVEFCDALIRSKLDIAWSAYINPRGITESVIRKYAEAGCHNLVLTPDALSDRVLSAYRKDFTMADVKSSIEAINAVGVPFEVSVILGGPGEDESTVEEAVQFCDSHLAEVPVLFFDGMWLHPSAPPAITLAYAEGIIADPESLDFDRLFLENDFATNSKLNYFFPHVKRGRKTFLDRIYAMVRGKKRIVAGRDFKMDHVTGISHHAKDLGIVEGARPWHLGMTGRGDCN